MQDISNLIKVLGDLLALAQSNPLLLLTIVVICAFVVIAMALRVVHAALAKK